ncbi:MAG: hypothetical protein AB7I19_00285 [Planctomycetota bacterium]
MFGTRLTGQSGSQEVIHVYVDPRNGSDDLAAGSPSWNPNGGSTAPVCAVPTTPNRPNDVIEQSSGQPLRHAPHPFRTIGAALRYIGSTAQLAGSPPGTDPLPYPPSPAPGQVQWTHAIVHLLPGLYAPDTNWYPDFLASGNGEAFPLVVPPRVSIQGTSGLNTILFAKGTSALVFGAWFDPVTNQRTPEESEHAIASTGEDSIVSAVTFYACGADHVSQPSVAATEQAAVLLDGEVSATPTICNCFFVKNRVGVLVNAGNPGIFPPQPPSHPEVSSVPPAVVHNGTSLIGNTFVWNAVGVWNGEYAEQTIDWVRSTNQNLSQPFAIGWSKLIVVNNIFDSMSPGSLQDSGVKDYCSENNVTKFSDGLGWWRHPESWPFTFADTGFEGIPAEDMEVLGVGDFNAYEEQPAPFGGGSFLGRRYNRSVNEPTPYIGFNYQLPAVGFDPARPTMQRPAPSRNIAPFTGWQANVSQSGLNPRGVLYIRDMFCLAREQDSTNPTSNVTPINTGWPQVQGQLAANAPGFDGSPLDFRLHPTAAAFPSGLAPTAPPPLAIPNPLVDNGFDIPATGTVAMTNGMLLRQPGIPGHPTWSFSPWAFDVEGYGNPRSRNHTDPRYVGTSLTDIGADEVGDLIIAGYRMGTTMFVRLSDTDPDNPYRNSSPGLGFVLENQRVYTIGPANTVAAQMSPGHQAAGFPAPMHRVYPIPALQTDFPLAYADSFTNDSAPVWHSFETITTGVFQRPWVFSPPPPPSPPISLSALYLATAADVTPHLLPDPHPWWSQFPGQLPNSVPTSYTLYQDCLGAGVYNGFLYVPPITGVANPAGSGIGFFQSSPPFDFLWLDGASLFSVPVDFKRFYRWLNGPGGHVVQDQFDQWGRVGRFDPVQQRVVNEQPSLPPSTVTPPTGSATALRFSLEHNAQGFFAGVRNMQSFLVRIQD